MTSDETQDTYPSEPGSQIWVNNPRGKTVLNDGIVIKPGPQVKKIAQRRHVRRSDGRIDRSIRFRSFDLTKSGCVDDFGEPEGVEKASWHCAGSEIDDLIGFLTTELNRGGRYRMVRVDSGEQALLELLERSDIAPDDLATALFQTGGISQVVSMLATTDVGAVAAQAAVVRRRRERVAQLRQLVDHPASTESQVQRLIGNAHWIFGGRYVGVADRRKFIPLDEYDIPLLGADGTLHIVELKGPSIRNLVKQHRNHWIVGSAVHEATAQAINYLRQLDETGLSLSRNYENEQGQKYDMSRVFATVIIGHSDHHRPAGADPSLIARTLRQYNAHLSRVEVITYDQLVNTAARALAFEDDHSAESPGSPAAQAVDQDTDGPAVADPWGPRADAPAWADDEPPF